MLSDVAKHRDDAGRRLRFQFQYRPSRVPLGFVQAMVFAFRNTTVVHAGVRPEYVGERLCCGSVRFYGREDRVCPRDGERGAWNCDSRSGDGSRPQEAPAG
jgi:hypothetical protein